VGCGVRLSGMNTGPDRRGAASTGADGVNRSDAVGERTRPVAVRVGVPGGAIVESVRAGTEPVAGLAGRVGELGDAAGVDAEGAAASGCCGDWGLGGMNTCAVLRVTGGGGVVVSRSDAVGERPVGDFGGVGGAAALARACVRPKAGGSGPVEGRDERSGAEIEEVGGFGVLPCGGSGEVDGRAGGTWICDVRRGTVLGGAAVPGAGRVDMPEMGGSGSVVGREPGTGLITVGAREKTGGVTLPDGVGVTLGRARVGGRGGAGWVVRCSCTVGGREKVTDGFGPVTSGGTLGGGRIAPGDD
jgi:hypothetical protein